MSIGASLFLNAASADEGVLLLDLGGGALCTFIYNSLF